MLLLIGKAGEDVKWLKEKKKNALFGRYPCCDHVNNAIRFIMQGKTDVAIDVLFRVIIATNGYIHEDIAQETIEAHNRVVEHMKNT